MSHTVLAASVARSMRQRPVRRVDAVRLRFLGLKPTVCPGVTLDEPAGFDMEAPFKFAWTLRAEPL